MPPPPPDWSPFFTALATTGNLAAACRSAGLSTRSVRRRIAGGRVASPTPAQAAWLAQYRQAKQAALERRREALRRVEGPEARLAALVLAGRNHAEIARELGCHRASVARRLARLGLSPRRPDFSPPSPLTKPHPNMISSQQWDRFFTAFAERANISDACRAAGISNTPVYDRIAAAQRPTAKPRDQAWLARFNAARETAVDSLEAAAFGRARDGVEAPVVRGSAADGYRTVAHIRQYSDGLLQFLLRAHRPQVYRDRLTTEHTGPEGRPIQTESRLLILPPLDAAHPE